MTVVEADLREHRKRVWAEARHLIEETDWAGRGMTRAQRAAFDGFNAELDVLDRRIAGLVRVRERRAAPSRTCAYCRAATEHGRSNCRNCGAPREDVA